MTKTKSIPVNLLVVVVSVFVALFLCEGVLGLLGFPSKATVQTAHPAGFHEMRENIEFRYEFSTNSQGLRYREVPLEKEPNSHRVFVVGDSFTEGVGVPVGERFTDILEQIYDRPDHRVLFINGGLSGSAPVQYGRLFFDGGVKYDPDALLVCIYANDVVAMPDIATERPPAHATTATKFLRLFHSTWPRIDTVITKLKTQREYKRKTQTSDFVADVSREAVRRGIPQKRIDEWKQSVPSDMVEAANRGTFNRSILSYGLLYPSYWTDSIDVFSATAQTKWNHMTLVLTEIVDECRKKGFEVALVFIPSYFLYDPRSYESSNPWIQTGTVVKKRWLDEDTQIQKRLESWTQSKNVPFLDLTPTFREAVRETDGLNWKLDGHWTPLGHKVAAGAIAEWLSDGQVFSFIRPPQ